MMKNSRFLNLAKVSPEKFEADQSLMQGIAAMMQYFEESERESCTFKASPSSTKKLTDKEGVAISDKKYMYSVLPNGSFCVDNVLVHSQFNAGMPVQSAGWVIIKDAKISCIDNNSGHYTPSISQFLTTLVGLHHDEVIGDSVDFNLNSLTILDYNFNLEFFESIRGSDNLQLTFLENGKVKLHHLDSDTFFIIEEHRLCENGNFEMPISPKIRRSSFEMFQAFNGVDSVDGDYSMSLDMPSVEM